MGPEIITTIFEGKRKVTEKHPCLQRQCAAEVFGHADKKPTALLSSPEITFTKYNGFGKISATFADGTHGA
jgi:hypothetical protein